MGFSNLMAPDEMRNLGFREDGGRGGSSVADSGSGIEAGAVEEEGDKMKRIGRGLGGIAAAKTAEGGTVDGKGLMVKQTGR